jgi:hypothetical protein
MKHNQNKRYGIVPSGGLTLIVGTQKWVFSRNLQRRPAADFFLNESLPLKTPCGHHVQSRRGHGSSVKNRWRFSIFCKKYETLSVTLKICILQEHGFKELTLVLFESLFFKGYTFCFTIFWSDHLLEHSKAMNEPQNTRSNDLERSKFRQQVQSFVLCASLKTYGLQICRNA